MFDVSLKSRGQGHTNQVEFDESIMLHLYKNPCTLLLFEGPCPLYDGVVCVAFLLHCESVVVGVAGGERGRARLSAGGQ